MLLLYIHGAMIIVQYEITFQAKEIFYLLIIRIRDML